MITGFFAALGACLWLALTANVIRLRGRHQVLLGDGNHPELLQARSAHSNLCESLPLFLLLLGALELTASAPWVLWTLGGAFIAGRIAHAIGILRDGLGPRVGGMLLTLATIGVAAALNLLNVTLLPL